MSGGVESQETIGADRSIEDEIIGDKDRRSKEENCQTKVNVGIYLKSQKPKSVLFKGKKIISHLSYAFLAIKPRTKELILLD